MSQLPHLNILRTETLPSPHDLMVKLPITPGQQQFIEKTRQEIKQIIEGKDQRILLIVGPCSIHDTTAAKEYARKLHDLRKSVSDTFLIVMRVYFEKPRTTLGWKGFLYDPLLDGSHDISSGIHQTRQLLLDLAEMEIPTAAEFLDLSSAYYFGDLLSWGCIGARTASSQTHRQVASVLSMPVAFKNSTDGNIDIAISGVINAATPHTFIGMNHQGHLSTVHTTGNTHGHIVLRGGEGKPNYDPEAISYTLERLQKANLAACVLIDCAHDNSARKHDQQTVVFQSIINQIIEGNRDIRGALIESHLEAGNQPMTNPCNLKYGVSVTDPCLNWETTDHLIRWADAILKKEQSFKTAYAHIPQEVK